MFNLTPWKKRSDQGTISVRQSEPSRQELGHYPLHRFREDFESLMSDFFGERWGSGMMGLPSLWEAPQFDWNVDLGLEDNEKEYVFRVEAPGFEPGDFDVKVSGNHLSVTAEHREEGGGKKEGQSYRYGSLRRSFTLPHGVEGEKIDASYHSGVLEIHLPKSEVIQGKRIPVKAN